MSIWGTLAFAAGSAIAVQAAMNSRLGVLLSSSLLGTGVAFLVAFSVILSLVLLRDQPWPSAAELSEVPAHLWLCGGVLSAIGVGLFYYLIPKMGVALMMSHALAGQIVVSMLIGHFGWLGLPVRSIGVAELCGVIALITGVALINWSPGDGV